MGNLNNVQFDVGSVPDGEYCDIIHNCQQKIRVSGGRATFNKAQGNDPVAAICVGCKQDNTSQDIIVTSNKYFSQRN